MPGRGKVRSRPFSPGEFIALRATAKSFGISEDEAIQRLGNHTLDVYLNEVAMWRNVPAAVWDHTVGGYGVLKKWLSYRDSSVLGRPLNKQEVRQFTESVRRTAALLLLGPELDANYVDAAQHSYAWSSGPDSVITEIPIRKRRSQHKVPGSSNSRPT
jgi:hypothetical protein